MRPIYWVSVSGQEYTQSTYSTVRSHESTADGVDAIGSGIVRRSSRVDDMTASASAFAEELVSQRAHSSAALRSLHCCSCRRVVAIS